MKVYTSISSCEFNANSVVTVGTFDGVHKGHKSIIDGMKQYASQHSLRVVVITFDPHPQIVLNKADREPIKILSTVPERVKLLANAGVDVTVVLPFTFEFAQTSAEDFVTKYLVEKIGLKHIVIGEDHLFGKDRTGNIEIVKSIGEQFGFTTSVAPPLKLEDRKISSTQVRNALKEGNVSSANYMLGYEYFVEGIVAEGDGRGRKLGLPTANIECSDIHKLLPRQGVYFVSSIIDGERYFGMANIGTRPTFTDDVTPRLEVHYFDLNKMIYDRKVVVEFHDFIRNERKFESVDMFLSQIIEDKDMCYDLMEKRKNVHI